MSRRVAGRGVWRAGAAATATLGVIAAITLTLPPGADASRAPSVRPDGASATVRTIVHRVGVTNPRGVGTQGTASHPRRVLPTLLPHPKPAVTAQAPTVPASAVGSLEHSAGHQDGALMQNFDGIDAIQNRAAAGFNLEPPDEGLGASRSYVANFVNVTGGIYSTDGALLAGPFYLNTFFGESPDANTSDPRVYYDPSSQRWFATILAYDVSDQGTISASRIDVAVSRTENPTRAWTLYQIDTSNPTHYHCPCLADYPILGISRKNVYVSTNEFTTTLDQFNGTQIYALSKPQLVAGQSSVNTVLFENLSMAGAPAYHVQPANQTGASTTPYRAEWLMSSLDPNSTMDHRLGVWAITNERSVTTGHGMPTLSSRVIHSEPYSTPPDAHTPKGMCSSCDSGAGLPTTGRIATDFDAMQETQFLDGHLIGALNTGVNIPGDTGTRSGVAWFVVDPALDGHAVSPSTHVARQGYVAVQGEYLLYPHVNMTGTGAMAMTFGLTGPRTYPSAAWSVARGGRSFKIVKLAGAGTGPDNGFTATEQYGGVGRWGDYSNGEIIPGTNKVWLATQYIPNSGTGYSNWGNRIFELRLR